MAGASSQLEQRRRDNGRGPAADACKTQRRADAKQAQRQGRAAERLHGGLDAEGDREAKRVKGEAAETAQNERIGHALPQHLQRRQPDLAVARENQHGEDIDRGHERSVADGGIGDALRAEQAGHHHQSDIIVEADAALEDGCEAGAVGSHDRAGRDDRRREHEREAMRTSARRPAGKSPMFAVASPWKNRVGSRT